MRPSGRRRGRTQCEQLLDAVLPIVTLWHDPDDVCYATVKLDGRIERYRLRSVRFNKLMRQRQWQASGSRPKGVTDKAMSEAMQTLEMLALAGEERSAEVRVIRHKRAVMVDLGGADWSLICVTPKGWRRLKKADVPLIRPRTMRALPAPRRDPDALVNLRRLLNVESEADFLLIVLWLTAALYPSGPYPILVLSGEQGSTKSTLSSILCRLIDPCKAVRLRPPRNLEDLLLLASIRRIVALDNLSSISADTADTLCTLSTGAGLVKRMHFENKDLIIESVCRPALLTAIPNLFSRPDLADRCIVVTLPPVSEAERRSEAEVEAAFEAAAPGILALLLDGLATALRRLPEVDPPALPRMADFARLACAAAPAFGRTEADVCEAMKRNRSEIEEAVLEDDPVAAAIFALASQHPSGWVGTATDLLPLIHRMQDCRYNSELPRSSRELTSRLRRIVADLRHLGVGVRMHRAGRGRRLIEIGALAPQETAGVGGDGQQQNTPPKVKIIKANSASPSSPSSPSSQQQRPRMTLILKKGGPNKPRNGVM